jgi:sugar/nucleoside kinase (ribokinase family)
VAECDVLVVGDCNPDLIMIGDEVDPTFGQVERLVDEGRLVVGGSGSIAACGAARLGLRTAFVGVVGDDDLGRFMLEALRTLGVDVGACVVDHDAPTGVSVLLIRRGGRDRAILTAPGAAGSLSVSDVPADLVEASRHVHVASYFLQRSLAAELPALLDRARSAGSTVSVDPNWDPAESWDGGIVDLLPRCDVFLPNEAEATRIARLADGREAAVALAAHGPVVAVKCGEDGAVTVVEGAPVAVPAPRVAAVDTTGAGDAFDAGFLAGFLAGWDPLRAAALACACGALSTRAIGGTAAQPSMDEAMALMGRGA